MIVTPLDQRFILDATLIGPKDFDKTKTYGFVFALGSTKQEGRLTYGT